MKIKLISITPKKIILTILVFITQGVFLYTYYINQDLGSFFRFSYLTDIYMPVYTEKIGDSSKYLASVAQFSGKYGNPNPSQNKQEPAKSIPVLLYHGVVDNSDDANILLEDFRNQMFALKKAGWQTVSIEDFYKFIKGEKTLPDRSFLLTFDDGRKDSYYPVDIILSSLNYRATIFIITGHAFGETSPFYLSKRELVKMGKSGKWDIQAHTQNGHDFYLIDAFGVKGHFYTNKLWLEDKKRIETEDEFKSRIHKDFEGAKQDLQNELGINSIAFAFPFGDFGQKTINFSDVPKLEETILKENESVYKLAFYQITPGLHSIYNYPTKEPYLIKRVNVRPEWTSDNLLKILEAGKAKELPYYDNFTDSNGWTKDWGRISFSGNNSVAMSSYGSAKGSSIFLDGAYLWRDYKFKANVNLTKGQTFSLTARYKDGKNYTTCLFTEKSIRAEQIVDGEKEILSELRGIFSFTGIDREVGIGVYDNVVNCYLDGKIAMWGGNLDERLDHGGIGFKTWDPLINNSELIIKNVSVEEIK